MTTRFILTAATLAALMAPGRGVIANDRITPPRRHTSTADTPTEAPHVTAMIELAGLIIGIDMTRSARLPTRLDVHLQLDPAGVPPHGILVWAGRKNGWGAEISEAKALIFCSGSYLATVAMPQESAAYHRLWLAIFDPAGHSTKGSVPLPIRELLWSETGSGPVV